MNQNPARYAQVVFDIPLYSALSYAVPARLADRLEVGQLVQAPFRNKSKTGLLIDLSDTLEDPDLAPKLKTLVDIVDPAPLLSMTDLRFLHFVADYYFAPIGDVLRLALPSAVRIDGMKHYTLLATHPDLTILNSALYPVVESLSDGESRPIKALREAFSELTYDDLATLERQGFVTVHYEEEASSVRAKTETYYGLLRQPEEGERLGKNQLLLLARIEEEVPDPVSITALRDVVSSPYSSLKSLVEREILEDFEEELYRDPFQDARIEPPKDLKLTSTQEEAVQAVRQARADRSFQGFVLHGVTGSGKTEVYVQIIRDCLADGQRALVLLPEIALTPQFVAVFRGHFGDRIAVLHSGLSPAQKFDQWRRIKRDEVEIVIGARSAIFAPLSNLGVIVVDEEHDTSFKQERGTRYNARDMALVRGKLEKAQVVLGSATPILESFYNAQQGRLRYLAMPERVADRPLPAVEIIDMRTGESQSATFSEKSEVFSGQLLKAIDDTLAAEKQAILFLNRRGFSPCVLCESCGHLFQCPNCDVSLTYHRHMEALRCHHCDFSLRMPESCPECRHEGIGRKGTGTEKLEDHLRELYPRARIGRLDRDTSGGKALQRLLDQFRRREIDLLVGTQMVTKGHDFPHVTLVGVVLADMSLNFPDFRAAERTFQLLTQVAGRAGRAETPGQVYIQTYAPQHFSLTTAREHDYQGFASRELLSRKALGYPPFTHIVALKFEGANENHTIQAARHYASCARRIFRHRSEFGEKVIMLGPAMAPIARIKNRSRWQMLFKAQDRGLLRRFTATMLEVAGHFESHNKAVPNHVQIIVDVDPQSLL